MSQQAQHPPWFMHVYASVGSYCSFITESCIDLRCVTQKGTKNALETGRTFATLFADMDLRMRLLTARTEGDFKHLLWEHMKELAEEQVHPSRRMSRETTQITEDVFVVSIQHLMSYRNGLEWASYQWRRPGAEFRGERNFSRTKISQ